MPKTPIHRFIFLIVALVFAASASAASATDKGDPKAGHTLVYTCGGCHGVTGYKNAYPSYHVPRVEGKNYDYIVSALNEYKQGQRSHPTMRAQAESLSEQEIHDIAAYLSSIHP